MKRLFLIISFLTLLVSCDITIYTGNNNNEAPSIEEKPTEVLFQKDDLYGTWKITKAKYAEDATMTEWEYEDTYATFKENGLYEGRGHMGNGEGTYSVSGNTITTFISNAPFITYEVISLTGAGAEIKATAVALISAPAPVNEMTSYVMKGALEINVVMVFPETLYVPSPFPMCPLPSYSPFSLKVAYVSSYSHSVIVASSAYLALVIFHVP